MQNQLLDYKIMLKNTLSGKKTQKGNKVSLAIYPFMRVKWETYMPFLLLQLKRSFEKKNNENSIRNS
jgi:hypothetical protein